MKKQNVETIVLKNAKTGVAEKIQHECHNTGYGTKHFWKADAKFFELLSNFSAAESKVFSAARMSRFFIAGILLVDDDTPIGYALLLPVSAG